MGLKNILSSSTHSKKSQDGDERPWYWNLGSSLSVLEGAWGLSDPEPCILEGVWPRGPSGSAMAPRIAGSCNPSAVESPWRLGRPSRRVFVTAAPTKRERVGGGGRAASRERRRDTPGFRIPQVGGTVPPATSKLLVVCGTQVTRGWKESLAPGEQNRCVTHESVWYWHEDGSSNRKSVSTITGCVSSLRLQAAHVTTWLPKQDILPPSLTPQIPAPNPCSFLWAGDQFCKVTGHGISFFFQTCEPNLPTEALPHSRCVLSH